MSVELAWYMSCDGDSAHIGQQFADNPPSFETFTRIARKAEKSGFTTILVPTSQVSGHYGFQAPTWDSIINAAVIAPATSTIKLLLAVRTGVIHPAICARMMASLDELSGGRILYNIVTGGAALSNYGDDLDHDTRYERTDEFLEVMEGLWTQDDFSFEGRFYQLKNASVYPKPVQKPKIPFFMAGISDIARDIAVRRGDYWVFWGETPEQVRERVESMEELLEGTGRRLKYVTRFQIIARGTEEEAYEAAQEILSQADPEVLAHRGKVISAFDSLGTRDQQARTKEEMVGPNLWAGMGRIRSGSAVAIVGSYEQCARKIIEIEQAGIHLLILSGFPLHLECERVGEHVIPLVREMERELGLVNEEEDTFLALSQGGSRT
ncbi:MAG: LLM class flavin-dependent oxidoreductase [Nitrospinota bacterium]